MTFKEAKMIIYANVVYACELADFSPMTIKMVKDACDTVIALADRKTENNSEKSNNCETCKWWEEYTNFCYSKADSDDHACHYEPKTKPTGDNLSLFDKDINVRSNSSEIPTGLLRDGDFSKPSGWMDESQVEYERASEQREHDILYEPIYNIDDGSM